jgi:hypothetical protein
MSVFSAKQKRAFQTILSGLKFARYGGKIVRFLTLTTSTLQVLNIDSPKRLIKDKQTGESKEVVDLNYSFQILRKRILRYSPYRLYKEGYISKNKMSKLYSRDEYFKKFSFEYFKVETNELNGVMHITYRGSYLPYNFLVDNWQDIHLSWELNIKKIDLNDSKNAACYVVSQYVGGQGSSYVRSSQSWNWVFRGFKSLWYRLSAAYPDVCFKLWDRILRTNAIGYFYPQTFLSDFG